jgi:dipeptidyl aminopeptidase/acylaminoacyl peptidase
MEIKDLRPVVTVLRLTFPALFVHGIDDELIPINHTERLFEAYGRAVKDVN